MTELLDYEGQLRRTLASLPRRERACLVELLTRPPDQGAGEIGALFQAELAPSLAELLIDLEEEPAARALVVGLLRELELEESPESPESAST
jgi:hypothetical protein